MMENRGHISLCVGLSGIGDDLFREIERLIIGPENRRRAPDAARLTVAQKTVQRGTVATQHRGSDLGIGIVFQPLHQPFDEPMRR